MSRISRTFWIKRVEELMAEQDVLLWLLAERDWVISIMFTPGNTVTVINIPEPPRTSA